MKFVVSTSADLHRAFAYLEPGDTVVIEPGTYDGAVLTLTLNNRPEARGR